MAQIIWNYGEKALLSVYFQADSSGNFAPAALHGNFGVGLGCQTTGVRPTGNLNTDKARVNGTNPASSICEVDTTGRASGYARKPITRDSTGWPLGPDPAGAGSWFVTGTQVTITFPNGVPSPGGVALAPAWLWFVSASTTSWTASDCLFGSDLSTTRNFNQGDQEVIIPSYKET